VTARDEEAKRKRRDYFRQYRAERERIDYMPTEEASEAIEWYCSRDNICIAGAIDDLIIAGYRALKVSAS
jgi:hypothetical protein